MTTVPLESRQEKKLRRVVLKRKAEKEASQGVPAGSEFDFFRTLDTVSRAIGNIPLDPFSPTPLRLGTPIPPLVEASRKVGEAGAQVGRAAAPLFGFGEYNPITPEQGAEAGRLIGESIVPTDPFQVATYFGPAEVAGAGRAVSTLARAGVKGAKAAAPVVRRGVQAPAMLMTGAVGDAGKAGKAVRVAKAGSEEEKALLQQAFADWNANKAYVDNGGNYRVRPEPATPTAHPRGAIAPWNKEVKRAFKDSEEFHAAAQAAQAERIGPGPRKPTPAAPAPAPAAVTAPAKPPPAPLTLPAPSPRPLRRGATPSAPLTLPGRAPGGTPPAQPPAPPTTPGAAAPAPPPPPAAVGNRFLAPLRPGTDVAAEVVTSDNPVVRALAGKTGINPSILRDDPVGKASVAYARHQIEAENLTDTALASALDRHAQKITGRQTALPIGRDAVWGTTGRQWYDVFSKPDDYALLPEQRAYIDDFNDLMLEVESLRVAAGLKPLGTSRAAGEFYVPRQVKGIRGVEIESPSRPKFQRLYEEASEGAANGVKYETDPREVARLHIMTAYKEIAEKELADQVEAFSVTPKGLIPEPVRIRREQTARIRQQTERAGRQAILDARRALARPANTPRQIKARQHDLAVLGQTIADVAKKNAIARQFHEQARRAYTRALESARNAKVADGDLFGRGKGVTIPIEMWRNRFFPKEMAESLAQATARGDPVTGFEKVINTMRTGASVLDMAAPLVQGLPVLARQPSAWAKATWRMWETVADPRSRARWIAENRAVVQEMAQYEVPVMETEFFAGARTGHGLPIGAPIEKIPKVGADLRRVGQAFGKQTYGRFGEAYNSFLGVARAELWKAQRERYFAGDGLAELAASVRNMTGGLEARALAVGPRQRAAEGLWMAFSPKFLRSTVSLIADAPRLNTMRGRAAARTLATLIAGAMGFYIATGIALGKSEKDILRGLNPLSGKWFLSHEVNGDVIGIGGQVRAVAQLIGGITSTIAGAEDKSLKDLVSFNRFDNPFLNFYANRGAPALGLAEIGAEAVSGQNVYPWGDVTETPDLLYHVGTRFLPFGVQGHLEGQSALADAAAFVGYRTSRLTASQKKAPASQPARQRNAPGHRIPIKLKLKATP
ncbi:MAG: hypothetical protein HYT14_02680 [Candidatus Liptonbacteria bacterium]|nr:hypothetical protein [Candidatus Liptonbacteria bacterium]